MSETVGRVRKRWNGRVVLVVPLAVLVALIVGCTTEQELLLPWLMAKHVTIDTGGFGNSSHTSYYAKRWGFWRKLDAWAAWVLDDEHALLNGEDGWGILPHGSLQPLSVCRPFDSLTVPPLAGHVDCSEYVHDGVAPQTRVRAIRFDASGRITNDWTLSAAGEGRVFHASARVTFYDDDGTPYFVIMDGKEAATCWNRPCGCALMSPADDGARVVEYPELLGGECHDPKRWEPRIERPLREAFVDLRQSGERDG